MKIKHTLLLLALGISAYVGAVLFKIMHWAGGDTMLLTAAALIIAGVWMGTIKLLTHPRIRKFLNL